MMGNITPMDEHCLSLVNEQLDIQGLPRFSELVSKLFVRDELVLQLCHDAGYEEYPPLSGQIRKVSL